ncbi:hypothetical protein [Dulcicalothrix desertica]|uniref:hypothetical protein n=1 Tax=Dulcicalothrix desertica TaxID=32056 RepID=UPI000F8E4BA6|nr:hypothetical protein [Dulcicalothrix desertica]
MLSTWIGAIWEILWLIYIISQTTIGAWVNICSSWVDLIRLYNKISSIGIVINNSSITTGYSDTGVVIPPFGANKLVFGTFGSTFAVYDYATNTWDLKGIEPDISLNAVAYCHNNTYTVGDAGVVFCDGYLITELGSLCNFLLPFGDVVLTGGQVGIVFYAISGRIIHQHRSPLNCGAAFMKNGTLFRRNMVKAAAYIRSHTIKWVRTLQLSTYLNLPKPV